MKWVAVWQYHKIGMEQTGEFLRVLDTDDVAISLEMLLRGLYHFSRAYSRGLLPTRPIGIWL
ncbi:MAG: hypothetical protein KJ077_00375 [Anaerolineae bacterium]|nr:hypothetical protein [Anaerolineae bacterium]